MLAEPGHMSQRLIYGSASSDSKMGLLSKISVADIFSDVPMEGRDDRWIEHAALQLDKSKDDIDSYLKSGNDNLLLAT